MSDNTLIIDLYPIIKGILITIGSVIIAATCTSCACGGGGCSIGGTETHQILNKRLEQAKFVGGAEQWEK